MGKKQEVGIKRFGKITEQDSLMSQVFSDLSINVRQVILMSIFINLLVMAPSFYMLEVYDRVLSTKNINTLLMLSVLIVFIYVIAQFLSWIRDQMLQQMSHKLDFDLSTIVFNAAFSLKLSRQQSLPLGPFNDLKLIRDIITSAGVKALIDAPFSLLFLIIIFAIHPILGLFSVFVAAIMLLLSISNNKHTHPPLQKANAHANNAQSYANHVINNAQVIESMGMQHQVQQLWLDKQQAFLTNQAIASDVAGKNAALTKMIQTMHASLLLGLSSYLILTQSLIDNGSKMIVASILGGLVISPIGALINNWRSIISAKDAFDRLDSLMEQIDMPQDAMPLPAPVGYLVVDNLIAAAPKSQVAILRGVSLKVNPGEVLAIIGPSASGKSTLSRLLVGVWGATGGSVRLDGVDIYKWNKTELGPHVGYLSQTVDLFDGTIAENVSRFGNVDDELVIQALKDVGIFEHINQLSDGIHTPIGQAGAYLSGGQKQMIGLARAFYGRPKYIVLDEPNASLDEKGDQLLLQAIEKFKNNGSTLVLITHRRQILNIADKILLLMDGETKLFGYREEVLKALAAKAQPSKSIKSAKEDDAE